MPVEVRQDTMLLAADDPDLKLLLDAYAKTKERHMAMVLLMVLD